MDGNLALYPSSIVFLQIPIQQALRKTLLTRTDVQFPLSLLIWIGEDISYATRINDSPCSDRIVRLNLSVHLTQEPVVRMPFQSALKKQYSQILDLRQRPSPSFLVGKPSIQNHRPLPILPHGPTSIWMQPS